MKRLAVALSVGVMVAGAARAEVSGSLTVGDDVVKPVNGVALPATDRWDPSRRVLRVLLAEGPIALDGVADALDPERTIRDQLEGNFLVATIGEDGDFDGMYAFVARTMETTASGTTAR